MAVILADLEDFSYKEIADIMECPAGTVMSRLYRGRKLLQRILFDYAVEQGIVDPGKVPELAAEAAAQKESAAPARAAAAEAETIDFESFRRRRGGGGGAGHGQA